MAEENLDSLHMSLMQDVLPVGMAIFERVKEGGANKIMEVFKDSDDPLQS